MATMLETAGVAFPDALEGLEWPEDALVHVPYWVYTSQAVYQRELERIFYGPTWSYVGFADEIPNAGD